ncbi:MAG: TfoX/Sxy family protein, partial [Clostridium sp.]|nr:TfoX/Sxy family protein [Clostridium sp.]
MASSTEFAAFVCEQLEGVGEIRSRKMFGEYMVYINDKPVILVCDDAVYIKMLPCLRQLLAGCQIGQPYGGAKEHYIL